MTLSDQLLRGDGLAAETIPSRSHCHDVHDDEQVIMQLNGSEQAVYNVMRGACRRMTKLQSH